jgi:hypothetical protein
VIGWSSTSRIRIQTLIGSASGADKAFVRHEERDDYQAWLWGEVLLIWLLGAALALFVAYPSLRNTYALPQVRLVLDTAVLLAAGIVAVLAGIRFSVDGRRLDLLLCGGFAAAAGATLAFSISPVLGGQPLHRTEFWAGIGGRLFAATLIAAAHLLDVASLVAALVGLCSFAVAALFEAFMQTYFAITYREGN